MLNEVKILCKNDFADLGREKIIKEEKYKINLVKIFENHKFISKLY